MAVGQLPCCSAAPVARISTSALSDKTPDATLEVGARCQIGLSDVDDFGARNPSALKLCGRDRRVTSLVPARRIGPEKPGRGGPISLREIHPLDTLWDVVANEVSCRNPPRESQILQRGTRELERSEHITVGAWSVVDKAHALRAPSRHKPQRGDLERWHTFETRHGF